jgi:hypothetical protein
MIAVFLQSSLEREIKNVNMEGCNILLESGMEPTSSSRALYCAIKFGNEAICRLLVQYGYDPFEPSFEFFDTGDDYPACSPFWVASFREDKEMFRFFYNLKYQRFPSIRGSGNVFGDYPIHVFCRQRRVAVQAIMLLVEEDEANVSRGDGQGCLPFHLAVMAGAKLDVVFYLLQLYPDAIKNQNAAGNLSTVEMTSDASTADSDDDDDCEMPRPRKIAKTMDSFAS